MSYKQSPFEFTKGKNVQKSTFNLSHEVKTAFNPGYLVPFLMKETMPGDNWKINSEFMFRFEPLYYPIMQKMTMRADYYYVPNRILWPYTGATEEGWEKWISLQSEEEHPYFNHTTIPVIDNNGEYYTTGHNLPAQDLGVHLGLPILYNDGPGAPSTYGMTITNLNAFPISAYYKIWDWAYRNPQLEDEIWTPLTKGNNTTALQAISQFRVLSAKWEKDYLTSALPAPQLGDAIVIPAFSDEASIVVRADTGAPAAGDITVGVDGKMAISGVADARIENDGTIKDLRLAETLQSYYERIMQVGQRYRDFIKGLWGSDPQPNTIDQPVLIGSKFGRVQISDVMSTADTIYSPTASRRVGDYTGQANLYSSDGEYMSHYCHEHGVIMGIIQVNPNTAYGQGIERYWRRSVPTEYPLDMFAGIGDQEILKEEVFYNNRTAEAATNEDTFGYIPRFSEMKYSNNRIVGLLNYNTGLSKHLGRYWNPSSVSAADITLESDFVEVQPGDATDAGGLELNRVFKALGIWSGSDEPITENTIINAHIFNSIYVERALPYYSIPNL